MQKKFVIRDRCILLVSLLIFSIGTYSLFGNIRSVNFFESAAYQHRVKGLVTDPNGIPIPGVNVGIKGTSYGTFTNKEGYFYVDAAPTDVLILSYIGFKPLEVTVGNSDELSLMLEEDVTNLEAVTVNAGYYTVSERERTGNIAKVTAEEIGLQPVISPMAALNGRVAGLEILPSVSHGNPGAAPTVRIRGQNSLRGDGNYPLYIIDGVPVNSTPAESVTVVLNMDALNFLNPSNIESIEILKDADATAIYGSRGANGVVLITTKKGLNQKTTIRAQIYSGLSTVPNKLDLLNTQEYLTIRNRAFINDGIEPTEANAYDIVLWDSDRDVDWQDLIFGGTAEITDVNLSLSGGTDNTTFRIGSSYRNQGTVYMGDYDYNKITFGLNLNHTSNNKKFEANISVNYGVDVNNLIGYLNLTSQAFSLPPNAPPLFNDEGSLNFEDWGNVVEINNPLQGYFNTSETRTASLVSNFNLAYKIFHGLEFKTNFGYNTYDNDEVIIRPQKSYADLNRGNSSVHRQIDRISWLVEPQLIYDTELGEGTLNALAGITLQYSENKLLSLTGDGYVAQSLIGNLNAAEEVTISSNNTLEYKYAAIFGRLGYQWDHKYFINLTGRRDGSSRFGPGKRFSNFGAVGVAWILSEENIIKNKLPFLSFGKLRGSYGITGNDQIPDYGYLDAYEATQKPDGLYPVQLFNPNYSWEINKKLEMAFELGFIQNKVNVGLSWYRNRSSNQLVGYVLPNMTGFSEVQANLPATVQNTGWELELVTRNIQSKNLNWTTSFNISFPKNKLLNYPNIEQSSYANRYRVGYPLDVRLMYNYNGLDPETGYYSVEDFNEDGRLNFEDRQIIGNLGRKFYGGINNTVNYKNFSLQFLLEFAKQKGIIDQFNAGTLENQRNVVLEALEEETPFQKISQTSQANLAYSNAISSPFSLVDASFLRLRTFVIGYKLPDKILSTIGVSDVNIFLSGQNLFTITGYKGMDPETPRQITSFSGLRTITCGVQLNF